MLLAIPPRWRRSLRCAPAAERECAYQRIPPLRALIRWQILLAIGGQTMTSESKKSR